MVITTSLNRLQQIRYANRACGSRQRPQIDGFLGKVCEKWLPYEPLMSMAAFGATVAQIPLWVYVLYNKPTSVVIDRLDNSNEFEKTFNPLIEALTQLPHTLDPVFKNLNSASLKKITSKKCLSDSAVSDVINPHDSKVPRLCAILQGSGCYKP